MSLYSANYAIARYLTGKGFSHVSYDYRYYYFQTSDGLTNALATMPFWYRIYFGNLWA